MAYIIEKTGKSIEEAVKLALEELDCGRDEVEVEVVAAPVKGLWGILGSKDAKVKVWKKAEISEAGEAPVAVGEEKDAEETAKARQDIVTDPDDQTIQFIQNVTGLMGIEASVDKKESQETVIYTLNGPKMGMLIGRRGETLDALQYLSNIVAGKGKEYPRKRVVVDAEDYRQRREDTLIRLATRLASKAKKSGRRVVLEPMNPQERRVIHTALEKDPDVKSLSEGEEPFRRLVIYPTGSENRGDWGGRYNRGSRYDRGHGGDRGYAKSPYPRANDSGGDADDDGDEE
jgi:spoIIIJ-associated protein